MKKILLTSLLLSFYFITIHSQKPFYHKNKTISWVGETEFEYYLEDYDRLNFEPPTNQQEETRSIKLDPFATCELGTERYFTYFIINEVLENRRKVYSMDGDPMTSDEISNAFGKATIDTLITYDPITYKETVTVTRIEPQYQIKSFKVRQWWFYDKEKESIGSLVQAIAPVLELGKSDGSKIYKPLFWIDMKQSVDKDYDYNSPSVIWAKETLSSLSFKDVKKVKGRTNKTLKNVLYKEPKKGKTQVLHNDSWYSYCADEMEVNEVESMLSASKDTIVTFHPETFAEDVQIIKNPEVKFKDFDYMRVLQHWYFDKSTNSLASKVISIGPLQNIYDDKGKLKYRRAVYYVPSGQ